MTDRLGSTATDAGDALAAFQDRLVSDYVEPYGVTFAYWAFAFVFLYLGLQKVVPHRSSADVQLATVGGVLGVPYVPFVAFVGAWQMAIGAMFLVRRLRLAGVLFVTYQVFTFSTLVVLRYVVFQPPWITVFGVNVQWALGSYAAFVLKNLVLAGAFFVLVAIEVETSPGESAQPSAEPTTDGGRVIEPLASIRPNLSGLLDRVHAGQDFLVETVFRPHGVTVLYWSFAFVFFYFGFQKPAPVYSPVRLPLSEFFPHFGIPLPAGMLFIGAYEMFLGLLFLFRRIRVAFWFFLPHQAVTFLTLLVIPSVAFQPPWIDLFGVQFPWALTGFGAFVIKNVVFVAGLALLFSVELGRAREDGDAADGGGDA